MTALPLTSTFFTPARRVALAVHGLTLLSVAAFSHLKGSPTAFLLALVCVILSLVFVDPARGRVAPKLLINLIVISAAVGLWLEIQSDYGNLNLIHPLGHFIVALLLCKLFDRRGIRDYAQIVVLSILLVIASTMLSSTLSYAVLLCAYFALLFYAVTVLSLHIALTEAGADHRLTTAVPALAQSRLFLLEVRHVTFRGLFVMLPIALCVFLTIPRTRGAAFFSQWSSAGTTFQTGYSNAVQFHDYGQMSQSDVVVMEVRLTQSGNSEVSNIGSEFFQPYFRGQTLETYSELSKRWFHDYDSIQVPAPTELQLQLGWSELLSTEKIEGSSLIRQEYLLHATANRQLFTIAPPVSISSGQFDTVLFNPTDLTLSAGSNTPRQLQYVVASLPILDPMVFAWYAPVPTNSVIPPVPGEIARFARNIAQEILPPPGDPIPPEKIRAIVNRFETYLRDNYPYSLSFQQIDYTLDPTADFLINRKEAGGHCEYFASAMVMLCRSVGLNARMVTGFHGGDYNSLSGYYVVRQRHAHAWAEVLLPGVGWLQSDPSPISSVADVSPSIVRRWTEELSQIVQNAWLGAVVGFDNDSRRSVMQWFTSLFQQLRQPFTDLWAGISYSFSTQSADIWMRLSLLLPALGLIMIGSWVYRRVRRERLLQRSPLLSRRTARLSGDSLFLDELIRLVARSNGTLHVRRPDQTPREFILASASTFGPTFSDAEWLVRTFYHLHFGHIAATAELRSQINAAMRRIKEFFKQQQYAKAK